MHHLRRLGNRIVIPLPADENAFTGRECPQSDCEGYFKIELGTGLKGEGLPCHCPYCGHTAAHDHFWTRPQIDYTDSVAMRKITDALQKDLLAQTARSTGSVRRDDLMDTTAQFFPEHPASEPTQPHRPDRAWR